MIWELTKEIWSGISWNIEMKIFKNPNSFLSKIYTHVWSAMRNEFSKYDFEKYLMNWASEGSQCVRREQKQTEATVKEEEDEDEELQQLTVLSLVWIWFDLICWLFHSPLRKTGLSFSLSSTNCHVNFFLGLIMWALFKSLDRPTRAWPNLCLFFL